MKKKYGLLFILSFAVVINTGCTGDQQTILGQASTPTMTLTAPTPDEEASQEAPGEEETDSPADAVDDDETEEPAPVPTATEVKPEYTYTVTPEIQNFRECYVPVEELLDGSYWNWLNEVVAPTLLEDFKAREDQIRDDIPIYVAGLSSGAIFFYPEGDGIYEDEEVTAPWNRKVTFAFTKTYDNDRASEFLILPVFYYDKATQQVFPVVTIQPIWNTWGEESEEILKEVMEVYLNEMNTPLIKFTSAPSGSFNKESMTMGDPLVSKFYEKLSQEEVLDRSKRFFNGDYSAFSSPDMIISAVVTPDL